MGRPSGKDAGLATGCVSQNCVTLAVWPLQGSAPFWASDYSLENKHTSLDPRLSNFSSLKL